jgi:ABC-type transporter Mla MlaB component
LVFSIFSKKPEKKPEKPAAPPKVEARRPASSAPAAPAPADEGESLDFTSYVPPPASQASAPSAPPSAPASISPPSLTPSSVAPPSIAPASAPESVAPRATTAAPAAQPGAAVDALGLDFGALAAQATGQQPAPASPPPALASPPSAARAPAPKPAAKKKPKGPVDSILCIEVEEGSGHDIPAAIEEAAILFANGQVEEALGRATKAIEHEDVGLWKLQLWLMQFDLLQQLGRKQEFEEKALDFVMKFERSPPPWVDAPTAAARGNPAMRTGGLAHVALTGVLGAQSAAALDQLKKAAERQPKLRLDFAKLQSIEPAGCTLLRDTLRAFKAGKKDVYLTGEPRILQLLRAAAKAGDKSADVAAWLLLLELYQMLGMHTEFEEAAVDYAVTYEVSPPSWEAPPARPLPLETSQPIALDTGDEAFHVVGEVAGQSDQLFTDIAAYASANNPVTLELAATKRIDFVNAGRLLNVLEKQQAEGKELVIRGAGEMIIALFAVMGITKIARIIPRK